MWSRNGGFLFEKYYNIMVVPESHSKSVRHFRFRFLWVKLLVLFCFLNLCMIGVLGYFLLDSRQGVVDLSGLQTENRNLIFQVQSLADQVDSMQTRFSRISQMELKVRAMLGLEEPPEGLHGSDARYGIGGPWSEETLDMSRRNISPDNPQLSYGLRQNLARMDKDIAFQELNLQNLQETLEDRRSILSCTPSIWPAHGWVTSRFGWRVNPYTRENKMHYGIDIAGPTGTPIHAPADGIVSFAGRRSGYGNLVTIDHGYGFSTRYGHCSEILSAVGDRVTRGDVIATVGATGRSTGPHLHYEVRIDDEPVNPERFLIR